MPIASAAGLILSSRPGRLAKNSRRYLPICTSSPLTRSVSSIRLPVDVGAVEAARRRARRKPSPSRRELGMPTGHGDVVEEDVAVGMTPAVVTSASSRKRAPDAGPAHDQQRGAGRSRSTTAWSASLLSLGLGGLDLVLIPNRDSRPTLLNRGLPARRSLRDQWSPARGTEPGGRVGGVVPAVGTDRHRLPPDAGPTRGRRALIKGSGEG